METPLQQINLDDYDLPTRVTILILVETPLQLNDLTISEKGNKGHNPYYSGNSFAT